MTELEGEALLQIDRAVRQFENAWQAGERPSLEAILANEADGRIRDELLRYALAVELVYRRRLGEVPEAGDYKQRFPDQARVIETAFTDTTTLGDTGGATIDMPIPAAGSGCELPENTLLLAPSDPPTLGDRPPVPAPAHSHDRLGKYEVVRRLGDGGQGAAFLARDPDVGRLVVVKRYHSAGEDAATEAKALGRVSSHHACRCLELMRHAGEPFLVMEYIPGRSLSEVLGERLLTPQGAVRIAEQVAEGLEAVHACGLVHRDVKPSNVILGDDGVARLVDFGLAVHLGSEALQNISGTPSYMAPEQARGQWERVDARSDIYGLAGVLYTLLTGQLPHPGKSASEALEHARRGVVTPPRDLKLPRPVPRAIERVVMKALEPDPARRYASASELRSALHRSRLRPSLPVIVAALATVTILAGLAAWFFGRSEPSPVPVAVPVPAPAGLTGELIVRVWSPGTDGKRGLSVNEPGALPLRAGEQVHLEARLSRPAYAYLFWISGQGEVSQLYPRDDSQYGNRPRGGRGGSEARQSVHSPDALDMGFPMTGPGGLETALLLARRTPLPPETDLIALIGRLPLAPLRDEREVAFLDLDQGPSAPRRRLAQYRGIDANRVGEIDDPLLRLMERLRRRSDFEVIKAVRFAYGGESDPTKSREGPHRSPREDNQ